MDPNILTCPQCHTIALPNSKFCSNCGFALSPHATDISVGKQIWIYIVSAFLPPLGLTYTFKYLFSQNSQHQRIALISTILTVVSTLLTIWATVGILHTVQTQLGSYQNLGL